MPATRIADVIVPEVFNPRDERTAELSELYQSIIQQTGVDRLASSGWTLNMPFWMTRQADKY